MWYNDAIMETQCYWIRTDKELQQLAAKMREYANENPLTEEQVFSLIENSAHEAVGPMLRLHGDTSNDFTERYSLFVSLSSELKPLQITFLLYNLNGFECYQLTIADHSKESLNPGSVSRIVHFFLDTKREIKPPALTPPHVVVLLQPKDDPNV
jgi:hypothetical protein